MSLPPYNHNTQSSAYPNNIQPDRNQSPYQQQSQATAFQFPNQSQPYTQSPQFGLPLARPPPVEDKSNKRVRVSRAW